MIDEKCRECCYYKWGDGCELPVCAIDEDMEEVYTETVESIYDVAFNIKKFRKEAGLTQEELAYKIGKSKSSIEKYEAGKVVPSIHNVIDIAKALNVSYADLIGFAKTWTGEDIAKDGDTGISSFKAITTEMAELYEVKNRNYGNSFSEQYKDYGMTSVCIRLDDKIRRLKSLNKQGTSGTNDESLRDTLIDTAVYSVLAIMELDTKE